MTLNQMRKRLDEIAQDNEAHGWGERNDMPVYLRMMRDGRKRDHFYPLAWVAGCITGVMPGHVGHTIEFRENDQIQ